MVKLTRGVLFFFPGLQFMNKHIDKFHVSVQEC